MDHSAKLPQAPAIEAPGQATPQDPQAPRGPTTGPTVSDNACKARDPLADGAQPLANATREAFAQLLSAGMPGYQAYKNARGDQRMRYDNAKSQASRYLAEPAVAARVRWLRVQAAKEAAPPPRQDTVAPARENDAPDVAPVDAAPGKRRRASSQVVDKQELLVMLSNAVRKGQLDGQTVNALLKVHPDLTAGTDQRPDGAMVAAYLAQYGGHKGKAAVEAMGGLPAMARKVAGALGCTLAELAEACQT